MVKYPHLLVICLLTITISLLPQFSFSKTEENIELGGIRNTQSAVTFAVFDREFIFTNSPEDYKRSFQRLIANYEIGIPKERLPNILINLSKEESVYVEETVSRLVVEANEFSHFRENQYYQSLEELTKSISKLNMAAAIEVSFVDEVRKIVSTPTPLSNITANQIRFLYLINHARYQLLSAVLYKSSRID
ncbi:hypothetical protein N9E24_08095 [Alphaproteobacteria bacterium]|nr:hypothetical protein [Alphaproteobacteria bacterium]